MSGWLEVFIVVATIAIVIQMAILLAMFFQLQAAIRNFTRIATQLQTRIDPILVRTNRILEDSEDRIRQHHGRRGGSRRAWRAARRKKWTACSRMPSSGCAFRSFARTRFLPARSK